MWMASSPDTLRKKISSAMPCSQVVFCFMTLLGFQFWQLSGSLHLARFRFPLPFFSGMDSAMAPRMAGRLSSVESCPSSTM